MIVLLCIWCSGVLLDDLGPGITRWSWLVKQKLKVAAYQMKALLCVAEGGQRRVRDSGLECLLVMCGCWFRQMTVFCTSLSAQSIVAAVSWQRLQLTMTLSVAIWNPLQEQTVRSASITASCCTIISSCLLTCRKCIKTGHKEVAAFFVVTSTYHLWHWLVCWV